MSVVVRVNSVNVSDNSLIILLPILILILILTPLPLQVKFV